MTTGPGGATRPAAKLALAVLGLLLALALLEGGLRALAALRPPPVRAASAACAELPEIERVAELYSPRTRGCYRGVVHRTNALGVRGGPLASRPDLRILLVGDSVAMGSGVEEDDTYAKVLERSLNAADPARRAEVVNAGVAGFAIESVAARAERLAPRLAPDLVVYGYTLNDLEGEGYVKSAGAWGELRGSPSALVRLVGPRLYELAELFFPPPGSYVRELDENYRHNPATRARLEAGLARMARLGERQSACVVVFLHTYLFHLNRWHPLAVFYELVAERASAHGLYPVRSLPVVVGESRESLWVGPIDPHPSARGHALFARALEQGLRALPETCRAGL